LVAIEVIQRIKKNAVIFCESQVSAEQWKSELTKWTTIDSNKIIVFSNKFKKTNPKKIE
jgi:superfamily II DNA or RNA helicase